MLPVLLDDCLSRHGETVTVRLALPWIRSLPLACLSDLRLWIDDVEMAISGIRLGSRLVPLSRLGDETAWWYVQDRVAVDCGWTGGTDDAEPVHTVEAHTPGLRAVRVTFNLLIPYLSSGGSGPLILPFRDERRVATGDHDRPEGVARDVA